METYPKEFYCPITQEVMKDPVIGPDSQTYERANIVEWLNLHHSSPLTRMPMEVGQLIPNLALRNAIHEKVRNVTPTEEIKGGEAAGPASIDNLNLALSTLQDTPDTGLLHISVVPPKEGRRKPVGIICVLDTSGSMGEQGSIEQMTESAGFSILDLVKHAVKTIVQVLGPDDYFGLVAFSDSAKVAVHFQQMTMVGKQAALDGLESLSPNNNTNIWDAMRIAMDMYNTTPIVSSLNTSMWLFTDGVPNINPPRGIVPTVLMFMDGKPPEYAIHTFGFGYSLDSRLLSDLANIGHGIFCYLPDCNLVGTTFVNCLANTLATATNQSTIELNTEGIDDFVCLGNDMKNKCIHTGPIQYGQTRDFIIRFKPKAGQPWKISAKLSYQKRDVAASINTMTTDNPHELYVQLSRCKSMQILRDVLNIHYTKEVDKGFLTQIIELITSLPCKDDERMRALLTDFTSPSEMEGRVSKAFTTFERMARWGKHYVRSIIRAHLQQLCHNFKDPSVQLYGGPLFKDQQHKADKIFCSLPPPRQSIKTPLKTPPVLPPLPGAPAAAPAAPPSMEVYMDCGGGGCFGGDGEVALLHGGLKKVKEIQKGDVLLDSTGAASQVVCLVAFPVRKTMKMVKLNGVLVTLKHPVLREGVWKFAQDLAPSDALYCDTIYNLVMDQHHIVAVNGVDMVTLGHGKHDNSVLYHPYYGTRRVLEDLQRVHGWTEGAVVMANCHKYKDPFTGLVMCLAPTSSQ